MTVAATQERVTRVYGWLLELARRGAPAPTNYDIARKVGMGQQTFQPADRIKWGPSGPRWKKCEAGAVMIAALEQCGLISVERGRNWRRIVLLRTGQVLEPKIARAA